MMALKGREEDSQDWQLTKNTVMERNRYMFNNPLISDIKFTCGESRKELHAHKYVLATSSPVFYAMFYGDLAEKNSIVALPDTDQQSFEEFLRFLYTDKCTLTAQSALKLFYLAKKYMVPSLTAKCTKVIEAGMKPENVVTILEHAIQFNEKELERKCWRLLVSQTNEAVNCGAFNGISQATLIRLLKRVPLNIKEVELFRAVLRWSEVQCSNNGLEITNKNRRSLLGDAIYEIRFLAMSEREFVQYVSMSGILTAEETIPVFHKFNGFDVSSSKWKLSNRSLKLVRCCRLSIVPTPTDVILTGRAYEESERLSFSVNKPAIFHGVSFLGINSRSKYQVSLEVKGEKVSGTYISEYIDKDIYGFNVLLPTSILVDENEIVEVVVTYKVAMRYNFKHSREDCVTFDKFTVTFHDSQLKTDSKCYQIIISA